VRQGDLDERVRAQKASEDGVLGGRVSEDEVDDSPEPSHSGCSAGLTEMVMSEWIRGVNGVATGVGDFGENVEHPKWAAGYWDTVRDENNSTSINYMTRTDPVLDSNYR
jgi:hypothetical protein